MAMINTPVSDGTASPRDRATVLGYLVRPDGREEAITAAMVDLALTHIEAEKTSLHGNERREHGHG